MRYFLVILTIILCTSFSIVHAETAADDAALIDKAEKSYYAYVQKLPAEQQAVLSQMETDIIKAAVLYHDDGVYMWARLGYCMKASPDLFADKDKYRALTKRYAAYHKAEGDKAMQNIVASAEKVQFIHNGFLRQYLLLRMNKHISTVRRDVDKTMTAGGYKDTDCAKLAADLDASPATIPADFKDVSPNEEYKQAYAALSPEQKAQIDLLNKKQEDDVERYFTDVEGMNARVSQCVAISPEFKAEGDVYKNIMRAYTKMQSDIAGDAYSVLYKQIEKIDFMPKNIIRRHFFYRYDHLREKGQAVTWQRYKDNGYRDTDCKKLGEAVVQIAMMLKKQPAIKN